MKSAQTLLHLGIVDYIIIGIVVFSVLISLMRGFLKELISLVVWALGFWVAIKFHDTFSNILDPYISNVSFRLILSFIGLFFTVLILGIVFNYLLSFVITKSGLSGFDRLLGTVFGLARGVLLIAVILLLISTTSFVLDEWWQKSVLIPHFQLVVEWLRTFLPQKISSLAGVAS